MWDNRCLTHLAVGDFDPTEIRHMIRTSCKGDYVGGLEDPAAAALQAQPVGTPQEMKAAVSSLHD
jgi:hypothetical protein